MVLSAIYSQLFFFFLQSNKSQAYKKGQEMGMNMIKLHD